MATEGAAARTSWRALRLVAAAMSLGRVLSSLLIFSIVFLPSTRFLNAMDALLLASPFFFLSAAGFAVNDVLDYRIDALNKPYRAIARGAISRQGAAVVVVVASCAGLVLAGLAWSLSSFSWLYLVYFVLAMVYNVAVRRSAILKTTIASAICASPVLFVELVLDKPPTLVGVTVGAAVVYIMGREIRMDVLDLEGDRAGGNRTVALSRGPRAADQLSRLLLYVALAVLLAVVLSTQSPAVALPICLLIVSLQGACEYLWGSLDRRRRRRSILLQWAVMLMGVGAAVLG
ncbi:MAG: UbiA family prenyltransferase [Propionibacteriaceae bacterium]|jgi:4-hydroxybenzoate polyprenyltransferase|nr:UbiA family prenyltransferase [Propionibacteriaceae bacterium]